MKNNQQPRMPANLPSAADLELTSNNERENGDKIIAAIDRIMETHNHNMLRSRPYGGQPHTVLGQRGAAEIHGITFRDLHDALIRAFCVCSGQSHLRDEARKGERAALAPGDVYGWDLNVIDPIGLGQELMCEIEKMMGTYPNVAPLEHNGD